MTMDEAPAPGRAGRAAAAVRHQRGEPGPDLRLPARRQGQLRGRPGGRRRGAQDRPGMGFTARANRAFLGRAVRYLAAEAGIRQFLDIGTGIPTAGNTHQVAQADRARVPGGLRGLRPGRARARPRAADQPRGRRHRVHRRRPARHRHDPRPGRAAAGLHPAGGGDAADDPARDTGLRRPARARGQGDGRPAAGQLPRRVPPGIGSPRPGAQQGFEASWPHGQQQYIGRNREQMRGSSTAWTWWSPGSCGSRNGARTPAPSGQSALWCAVGRKR